MRFSKKMVKTLNFALCFLLFFLGITPKTYCLTISEEEKLGSEFIKYVKRTNHIIDDPDISVYINRIGKKVQKEFPDPPFPYHFYVIKEDSFNAFAAPGGHVFVNSGFIESMKSEDELAGILGHEISHVNLRHISSRIDYAQKVNIGTLAGIVAGVLLGVTGGGAAAGALTAGSMAAGQSFNLSYSRENEIQADQTGLQYINSAGYSCKGLLDSMTMLRSRQWFGPNQVPTYLLTHPAADERITYIKAWIEQHEKGKKFPGSPDPAAFKRIQARISGLYSDSSFVLKHFESMIAVSPGDDSLVYGYALALWRLGQNDAAMKKMRLLLKKNAFDPDYMRDTGIILFSSGEYKPALAALEAQTRTAAADPLKAVYIARTLMALEKYPEAERILSLLVKDRKDYTAGYYYMADVCSKSGRDGLSHYYLGVYESRLGRMKQVVFHLDRAMPALDAHPDFKKNAESLLKEALKELKKERDEKEKEEEQSGRTSRFRDSL